MNIYIWTNFNMNIFCRNKNKILSKNLYYFKDKKIVFLQGLYLKDGILLMIISIFNQ